MWSVYFEQTTAKDAMSSYSTLKNPKTCSYENCGRKHYAKGLCHGHYQQTKRGVDLRPLAEPMTTGARVVRTCSFDPCDKPSRTNGLCSGHWNQKNRGQELRPLRARRANGTEMLCSFEPCGKTTTGGAYGLCRGHYRQRRLGRELEPLPDWNDNFARDDQGRKCCASCRKWLPVDTFYSDKHRSDGLQTQCPACVRSAMLLNTYGITTEQYDAMLSDQGGGCAICGVDKSPDGSSLAVDHDHTCCSGRKSCGRCVRALLCRSCNQGLGNFQDRTDLMRAAALYIEKYHDPQ